MLLSAARSLHLSFHLPPSFKDISVYIFFTSELWFLFASDPHVPLSLLTLVGGQRAFLAFLARENLF